MKCEAFHFSDYNLPTYPALLQFIVSFIRITEWLMLEGTSGGQSCSPTPMHNQEHPEQINGTMSRLFLIISDEETPQPLWALCSYGPQPAHSKGTSCVPVCTSCLLPWH